MIVYPKKRTFGLLGAPRAGKHTVAKYLQESRNFDSFAFGDKIKTEFGIGIEEFEAAKATDKIDGLRQQLWNFSAIKRDRDPLYFIRKVMDEINESSKSCVIVDIRTPEELQALFNSGGSRVYFVMDLDNGKIDFDDNGFLNESKIHKDNIASLRDRGIVRHIHNHSKSGVFKFYKELERFFFMEDIMDLSDSPTEKPDPTQYIQWRRTIEHYTSQFSITER